MRPHLLLIFWTLFLIICSSQLFAQTTCLKINDSIPHPRNLLSSHQAIKEPVIVNIDTEKSHLRLANTGLQAYKSLEGWRTGAIAPSIHGWNNQYRKENISSEFFLPNNNTATGTNALVNNTTGFDNTADGYGAIAGNTTGSANVGVGFYSLQDNNGSNQTAVGAFSMWDNGGNGNTALGFYSLAFNVSGNNNTAVGASAMSGVYPVATESNSVAVGSSALFSSNSPDGYNTAIGTKSMYSNTTGYSNVANGAFAMYTNTSGYFNAVNGTDALYSNTTGYNNTANGFEAMYSNIGGSYNLSNGIGSMYDNTSGNYNSADGTYALESNSSGDRNTAIGAYALESSTTGDRNSALGYDADVSAGNLNNATALGAGSQATASNSVVIGSSAVTSIGGYANWTNFSDGRYKQNIQQNVPGLEFINKLKPITYTLDISGIENKLHENQKPSSSKNGAIPENYLNDPLVKQSMQEKSAISFSGFVAQDVEKAVDSLGYNFSGIDKPKDANLSFYGLRYGDFVVPLVKAVQELSKINDSLNLKMDSMQQQINELRALVLSKTQFTGSVIAGASLDQNVPNPSSSSTTIAYGLPQGTISAQMQITDMNGKILQLIPLSGVGRSSLTIDTSSLASGIYSYSLLINGQLAGTKKMVSAR